MKKVLIYLFSLILLITLWIWKDFKKIDIHFVNQSSVTYDFKNLNNNFLKSIYKKIDKIVQNYLLNFHDDHKNYWVVENFNTRKKMDEFKIIKAEKNLTDNTSMVEENSNNWTRSHGNNHSNRYSNLTQINKKNSKFLELAWTFELKNEKRSIQANPIINDGIIYTPIAGGFIVAIDGKSGELIWKSEKFGNSVAHRGLVYWAGNKIQGPRIIFSNRERLISLDSKSGNLINTFGSNGQVRTGLNVTTPIIYKNSIVIVSWDHAVEVYDLLSGKTKWKLKYKKKLNKRVGGVKYNNAGSNQWGGISADTQRGILYFTTGNPHFYFDGTRRPGKNEMSNSVIAVDLNKKRVLWNFQETAHDIWNSDLPAPPILTTINKNNKLIDIVVAPTKRSNTLILDRLTGKPIFDFRLRKAPTSKLSGEKTFPYQPDLILPEPFGKNVFKFEDIWSYDKEKLEKLRISFKNYNYGFYETYKLGEKTLQYGFNGGAEWMGGSIDPNNDIFYVTSNNIPWITEIKRSNSLKETVPEYQSYFERAQDDKGFPITKPPWGTLSALKLSTGKIIWQVPFGEYKFLTKNGLPKTGTENFGGVTSTAGGVLFATGTLDKKFYVFDSSNGEILYEYEMPYVGSSPPSTYLYDKDQYVVVHSSGGFTLKKGYPDIVFDGNLLLGFKLKD